VKYLNSSVGISPRSAPAFEIGSSPAELDDDGARNAERGRCCSLSSDVRGMERLRTDWGRSLVAGEVLSILSVLLRGVSTRGSSAAGGNERVKSPSLADSKSSPLTTLSLSELMLFIVGGFLLRITLRGKKA